MEKKNEVNFDKIFNQMLGYLLFKDFCETVAEEPIPQLRFYEEVSWKKIKNKSYEKKKHILPLVEKENTHEKKENMKKF